MTLATVGFEIDDETVRRFWLNVRRGEGCWEWMKSPAGNGYGQVQLPDGRRVSAHRISWMLVHGPILDPTLLVCHHCDNPPCVRPDHLFLGTVQDNALDKVQKGRDRNQYRDAKQCIWGHAFTPTNTGINSVTGGRFCKACRLTIEWRRAEKRRKGGPRMVFPFIPLGEDAPEPLRGAWWFAKQKFDLEQAAVASLAVANARKVPQSVIDAGEKACEFAEDETQRAVELLFQEYRAFRVAQQYAA